MSRVCIARITITRMAQMLAMTLGGTKKPLIKMRHRKLKKKKRKMKRALAVESL